MLRQSRIVSHRLIARSCLISLPNTSALMATATDDTIPQISKNYSATGVGYYLLSTQGQNSVFVAGIDILMFSSDKGSKSAVMVTEKGLSILNNHLS